MREETSRKKRTTHTSLQHDSSISMPLLSLLVENLKKKIEEGVLKKQGNEKEDEKQGKLEAIAEKQLKFRDELEENEGDNIIEIEEDIEDIDNLKLTKDPVVALAERIKHLYASELMQQAYSSAAGSSSNANYKNDISSQNQAIVKAAYEQEGYTHLAEKKEELPKAISDENSTGYKISRGSKYQAFIMTDPKGRWHSTWEIVRIINETYDGMIEKNDGLHYQGLS